MYSNLYDRSLNMAITKMLYLKFGDGNGPNLCRVKKVDVSSTFIDPP